MTNLEAAPAELACAPTVPSPSPQILAARDVPLGGLRAMTVRRTLPQRARSFIGAWCFVDHYGPDDVAVTGGMQVPPHPHMGLQTVSWLFSGELEHRDSLGTLSVVRPGELNLMTAGRGISHSEVSTTGTSVLHGVQLWIVLPEADRNEPPGFEHHVPTGTVLPCDPPRVSRHGAAPSTSATVPGVLLRVFLGTFAGTTSPVGTFSPLLGAELVIPAGASVTFDLDPSFEHGVLVDAGALEVAGEVVTASELAYLAPGRDRVTLRAGETVTRIVLLGGLPLGEQIVMWWNFIGRDHGEIVAAREQWQREVLASRSPPSDDATVEQRFGLVRGYDGAPLPAPELPHQRLRARG